MSLTQNVKGKVNLTLYTSRFTSDFRKSGRTRNAGVAECDYQAKASVLLSLLAQLVHYLLHLLEQLVA